MDTPKILIADDDPRQRELLTFMLSGAPVTSPYQLFTAPDGAVAYNLAREKAPDLVITDWDMPHKDGIALLKALKTDPETQEIPVLMVTGAHLDGDSLKHALDNGAQDYLRKPMEKAELWARVGTALRLLRSFRKIKAQSQEIEDQSIALQQQKDRELATMLMEQQQKRRELKTLGKTLESLKAKADGLVQRELEKVLSQVTNMVKDLEEGQAFTQHFEKVHPSFLTHMRQQHPNITVEDLRYCAYLRMHLSNHEIAKLLNIAPRSVRTHKYRLKKKLGLGSEINLAEYLAAMHPE